MEEIARVHDASELKRSGSGWEAVVEVTAERRKRKDAAESSARDAGLDVEAVYENAVTRDVDPIDYLERATAKREEEIEAAARALLLDDEEITRIRDASALQEAGSGWGAVVEATAARRKRKDAAESSARDAGLDVEAVYENAVTRDVDPIDFLAWATAKQEEEIEAAARAVLLDDEEITRIRKESALQEAGSGWGAVVEATAARRTRKEAAESAAGAAGLDVEAVYENARKRDVDRMDFLERATAKREEEIEAAARAVLLDDEEITRIRDASALQEAGSGWGAVVEATAERRQRKEIAESAARANGVDVDAVYADARKRHVDGVEALVRKIRKVEQQRRDQ